MQPHIAKAGRNRGDITISCSRQTLESVSRFIKQSSAADRGIAKARRGKSNNQRSVQNPVPAVMHYILGKPAAWLHARRIPAHSAIFRSLPNQAAAECKRPCMGPVARTRVPHAISCTYREEQPARSSQFRGQPVRHREKDPLLPFSAQNNGATENMRPAHKVAVSRNRAQGSYSETIAKGDSSPTCSISRLNNYLPVTSSLH